MVSLPHTLPQSVEGLEKLFKNLFIPIDKIRRIPNNLQTSLLALAKATKYSQYGLQGFFNFQDLLLSIMKKVWSVSLFCFVCSSARGGKKRDFKFRFASRGKVCQSLSKTTEFSGQNLLGFSA